MFELVLARHGQSFGNLEHSLGPDTDLTDLGRQQAAQLGNWLADQPYAFTALYASPQRRACQTAEIVNQHFGLDITVDPDLRETEIPYLHILPRRTDALQREPTTPFGAEYERMLERVTRATRRILSEHPQGQVLVVAHAGTLGTMLRTILGTHALVVHTDLASLNGLRWSQGRWYLLYTNRQEHLVAEGIKE